MKLHWKILIGMLLGILAGLLVNESFVLCGWLGNLFGKLSFIRVAAVWVLRPLLGPIGDIFIKLLKMLIVPLILASMIVGVAKVGDIRKLGGLGGRTFVFYITTTFASVLVGLILVNLIKPGSGAPALGGVVPEAARIGRSCARSRIRWHPQGRPSRATLGPFRKAPWHGRRPVVRPSRPA